MSKDARYVGAVVLEIDGVEFEAMDFQYNHNTGRRPLKTMNSSGRLKGYAKGVAEYNLNFTVPVLIEGNDSGDALAMEWKKISKGKLTYWPLERPEARTTLQDMFVMEANFSTSAEGEGTIAIVAAALGEINE